MTEIKDDAVVLAVMDYGEADRLVTFLTPEHGKLRGIARHAKKSRRRFGGALEPFARLQMSWSPRDGLSFLHQAEIKSVFTGIREDILKIGYAGYACELLDRLVPEGQANRRVFRLLSAYLEHLDSYPPDASDRRFFEANILNILGYRLSVETCSCGRSLLEEGGEPVASGPYLFCRSCRPTGRRISSEALRLLHASLRTSRFGTIRFAADDLVSAGDLIDASIAEHLVRPLKSLIFLNEMQGIERNDLSPNRG